MGEKKGRRDHRPILVLRQCLRLALYLKQRDTVSRYPSLESTTTDGDGLKRKYNQTKCAPNGIAGPKTNPLRDRSVLFLGLGQLLLGAERFLALLILTCH